MIVDTKKMVFDNLVSLYHFNIVIKQTIDSSSFQEYDCKLCNILKSYWEACSGRYFELGKKGSNEIVRPWFGIWYCDDNTAIYIAFEKDQKRAKIIYDHYVKDDRYKKVAPGMYFGEPVLNNENLELCFGLKEDKYKEFLEGNIDKQKEILKGFFEEVICEAGQVLN